MSQNLTYGELRRRKRANGLYDDTSPNINEPVNDRSSDNDPEDMRVQAREDRLRADISVRDRRRIRRRGR